MLAVALTGGIGTGKSYVRARMAARGVPAVDADAVVHGLLGPGTETSRAIARRFGPGTLRADGAVDRRALGALVFADDAARIDLEALIHPRVFERVATFMAAEAAKGTAWAAADIPLLFETGYDREFDRIVVVACSPDEQLRRVVRRDGLTEADARRRLAAQWPIADKVARATHVIDTEGTFERTDRQVDDLCAMLDEASRRR